MLNKTGNILNVTYTLYGERLSEEIAEKGELEKHDISIPFSFLYNSNWKVEHECAKCKHTVSFGLHVDSGKKFNTNYLQLDNICSVYYDNNFLKEFPALFSSTQLKEFEGEYFVIEDGIFDPFFPISTSIEPILYNCPECKTQYMARMKKASPLLPDRNMPFGKPGKIIIDEIIQVEVEGGKSIIDFEKESSIKR